MNANACRTFRLADGLAEESGRKLIRLNSCFSWNSETLLTRRPFANAQYLDQL